MDTFGGFLKRSRIERRITLREFCEQNNFDPGNYSKLERGKFAAPRDELVAKYALALGIEHGSDQWIELFDLAAASRGQIPSDILSDEQLLQKLPVLFRTLRGTAVSPEKLDDLANEIRKS